MKLRTELYRRKEWIKRRLTRALWGDCVVLLYHRIRNTDFDPQQLSVSPDFFHDQLSRLKKEHHFITMEEFCDHLRRNKRFNSKCALITFDDGYSDNYHNALPILESLGLQAVFYISTGNIGTERLFWWDEIDLLFREQKMTFPENLLKKLGCSDPEDVYNFVLLLCKRSSSVDQRNEVIGELRGYMRPADHDPADFRSLSLDELRALEKSKCAVIGAHTENHLSLGHIPARLQREEIESSVAFLNRHLSVPVRHMAFPYGDQEHFSPVTIEICRELGLSSAAANLYEIATPKSDLFCFPRIIVRNDSPDKLEKKIEEVRK